MEASEPHRKSSKIRSPRSKASQIEEKAGIKRNVHSKLQGVHRSHNEFAPLQDEISLREAAVESASFRNGVIGPAVAGNCIERLGKGSQRRLSIQEKRSSQIAANEVQTNDGQEILDAGKKEIGTGEDIPSSERAEQDKTSRGHGVEKLGLLQIGSDDPRRRIVEGSVEIMRGGKETETKEFAGPETQRGKSHRISEESGSIKTPKSDAADRQSILNMEKDPQPSLKLQNDDQSNRTNSPRGKLIRMGEKGSSIKRQEESKTPKSHANRRASARFVTGQSEVPPKEESQQMKEVSPSSDRESTGHQSGSEDRSEDGEVFQDLAQLTDPDVESYSDSRTSSAELGHMSPARNMVRPAIILQGDDSKRDLSNAQYTWEPIDPSAHTGYDVRTRFGFYTLLWSRSEAKLAINIPEVVLLAHGAPILWMFTAKSGRFAGSILRRMGPNVSIQKLRDEWVSRARATEENFEKFVALINDENPAVLGEPAFKSFLKSSEQECDLGLRILQFFIKPLQDLVYRSTMTKKGEKVCFTTVSYRASHAYRHMSNVTGVVYPTRKMTAVGTKSFEEPVEAMEEPHITVANECHRCLQNLTRFCAKVWQLDLDELICDFIQDYSHKIFLIRVCHFEWRDGQFTQPAMDLLPLHKTKSSMHQYVPSSSTPQYTVNVPS